MLPHRRMELLLAQVSLLIAQSSGAKDASLSDFLFDPVEEVEIASAEDAREAFDFKPRNRK